MHQRPYRVAFRKNEQLRPAPDVELVNIDNAGCDGEAGVYEYSQAIFDLLKDPVSLGLAGSNSNRGRQR